MGSVGAQLTALRNEVSQLEPFNGREDAVVNPLIQNEDKIREIQQIIEQREIAGTLPEPEIKTVYLDRVYTDQQYLFKNKLNDMVDKPIHEFAAGYMYQGDVYIVDGNHRLALAKLNNQEKARVAVIDLDKKSRRRIFRRK